MSLPNPTKIEDAVVIYEERYSDAFIAVIAESSKRVREHIFQAVKTITTFPDLARDYMPYNLDQVPKIAIKYYSIPRTNLAMFLKVDESQESIEFLRLIDVRRDPVRIFEDLISIEI